jgi:putative intracellular protease/amidase
MLRFATYLAVILVLGSTTPPAGAVGEFVCPPCSCGADAAVHDAPGRCPACGMPLVPKEEVQTVAILLYDGVQIIDYAGPYEVFGQAGFRVVTVSDNGQAVTTAMGMKVTPDYSLASSPQPTILLIPGGNAEEAYGDPKVIDWVRAKAAGASHVLSVCNGAFILARAGLLDGLKATTFFPLLGELRTFAPKVEVVTDQRFVDNGKIITSAGLSSGIDAALYLVGKIRGVGEAERLALHLEYDWRPEAGFARGALAERLLPRLSEPEGATVELLGTHGDRDRWETRVRVTTAMPAAELRKHFDAQLALLPGWTRAGNDGGGAATGTAWRFADERGAPWRCAIRVEPEATATQALTVSFAIQKGNTGTQYSIR